MFVTHSTSSLGWNGEEDSTSSSQDRNKVERSQRKTLGMSGKEEGLKKLGALVSVEEPEAVNA